MISKMEQDWPDSYMFMDDVPCSHLISVNMDELFIQTYASHINCSNALRCSCLHRVSIKQL